MLRRVADSVATPPAGGASAHRGRGSSRRRSPNLTADEATLGRAAETVGAAVLGGGEGSGATWVMARRNAVGAWGEGVIPAYRALSLLASAAFHEPGRDADLVAAAGLLRTLFEDDPGARRPSMTRSRTTATRSCRSSWMPSGSAARSCWSTGPAGEPWGSAPGRTRARWRKAQHLLDQVRADVSRSLGARFAPVEYYTLVRSTAQLD